MKKGIIIGIIAVLAIGGVGFWYVSKQKAEEEALKKQIEDLEKKPATKVVTKEVLVEKNPEYVTYKVKDKLYAKKDMKGWVQVAKVWKYYKTNEYVGTFEKFYADSDIAGKIWIYMINDAGRAMHVLADEVRK